MPINYYIQPINTNKAEIHEEEVKFPVTRAQATLALWTGRGRHDPQVYRDALATMDSTLLPITPRQDRRMARTVMVMGCVVFLSTVCIVLVNGR